MSQFVKLTNRQIDKSATFSSFHCKIDKFINDIERIYYQYRKSIDTLKKSYCQIINQNSKTLPIMQYSQNRQIGKLANRQIASSTNRQICLFAN